MTSSTQRRGRSEKNVTLLFTRLNYRVWFDQTYSSAMNQLDASLDFSLYELPATSSYQHLKAEPIASRYSGSERGAGDCRGGPLLRIASQLPKSSSGLPSPRSSMVLVYLPTKLGHKYGVNVGKCTSTMDDLGQFSP